MTQALQTDIGAWAYAQSIKAPPEKLTDRHGPSLASRDRAPFLGALCGHDPERVAEYRKWNAGYARD